MSPPSTNLAKDPVLFSRHVWRCAHALGGTDPAAAIDGSVAAAGAALHAANAGLWVAEDAVRDRALPDAAVVALKRQIDHANLERHGHIAALDGLVDAGFPPQRPLADPEAVVDSQSVGQVFDRLSVLALKIEAHRPDATRLRALEARRGHLLRCLARVLDALAEGRGVPQRVDEAKTYGA